MRGYDKNGTPFTPCARLTKWKCYDPKTKRSSFSCEKECLREYALNPFPQKGLWPYHQGNSKLEKISRNNEKEVLGKTLWS